MHDPNILRLLPPLLLSVALLCGVGAASGQTAEPTPPQLAATDMDTGLMADDFGIPEDPKVDSRPVLSIAVMAIRGPEQALQQWQATADYLTEQVPGYRFVIKPLDFESFRQAMADDAVSFVLTNPGMYVEFEALYGSRRIATLKNLRLGKPYTEFGGVIFQRADRDDIRTIHDLGGKRFATVDESAFGGWQMAWRQMLELGFDPYRKLRELYSVGTHDNVVYEVLEGRADAGNVRTDTLERMELEGKIQRSDFALVYENRDYGDRFPFWLSTRLYPEWPFAILPNTQQELAEKVAIALMGIPEDSEAARSGRYVGWTVPGNYEPVHETLRTLRVTPYERYGEITWQAVLQQYWLAITGVILALVLLSVAVGWFRQLTQRLQETRGRLEEELAERLRAEAGLQQARDALQNQNTQLETTLAQVQQMQEQIIQQEKMASLGTLTAGIAHEIKNPLNFIVNFSSLSQDLAGELNQELEGVKETLDEETRGIIEEIVGDLRSNAEKILNHGKRADSIVRNMLEHSRGQSGEFRDTDVNALLDEYVNLAYHGLRAGDQSFNITIERDYDETLGRINVVPQDLSRVFLNLVNNACYAAHERSRKEEPGYAPTLTVSTRRTPEGAEIRVRDNGTGIPREICDKIFQPFFTTKPTGSGTGLGLSISYDIVTQQHGGQMTVESEEGVFTEFRVVIPARARQPQTEEVEA
jgi:signal transduction histidine kinase